MAENNTTGAPFNLKLETPGVPMKPMTVGNPNLQALNDEAMHKATFDPPRAGQTKGPVELAGGFPKYASSIIPYEPDIEYLTPFTHDGKQVYAIRKTIELASPVQGVNPVDITSLSIEKVLNSYGMQYFPGSTANVMSPVPNAYLPVATASRGLQFIKATAASGVDTVRIILPTGAYPNPEYYEITIYYTKTIG